MGWAWQQAGRARGWACRQAQGRGHGAQGTARRAWQQARALGSAQGGRRAGASGRTGVGGRAGGSARDTALAGARQGERACGWAHGARGAQPAGSTGAACAHRLGQLGARAPGWVFNLVFRLGIFPKSLNEHCSL